MVWIEHAVVVYSSWKLSMERMSTYTREQWRCHCQDLVRGGAQN